MNEPNQFATIQKIGEDLVIVIPNHICEKLDIKELCSGETGIRIKPKT